MASDWQIVPKWKACGAPLLNFYGLSFLKGRSCCVAYAGFRLLAASDTPASATKNAGITVQMGFHHVSQAGLELLPQVIHPPEDPLWILPECWDYRQQNTVLCNTSLDTLRKNAQHAAAPALCALGEVPCWSREPMPKAEPTDRRMRTPSDTFGKSCQALQRGKAQWHSPLGLAEPRLTLSRDPFTAVPRVPWLHGQLNFYQEGASKF
ncbi:hypothetical protein AAY473_014818 [Plecturocebus cupreus]